MVNVLNLQRLLEKGIIFELIKINKIQTMSQVTFRVFASLLC